jgi:prepilin-type N-terminal cleavage/methylation domain-containing protein
MFSLKKRQSGFTIVELLIVIVVIGILATLVIVTFTGIQQKARDSKRQTDINAVDSHIESYYAQSGNYPTFAQLTDATWRSTNMKGLDPSALTDPKGAAIGNSTAVSGTYKYGFVSQHTDNTACSATGTTDDTSCTKFVISGTLEKDNSIYSKQSN